MCFYVIGLSPTEGYVKQTKNNKTADLLGQKNNMKTPINSF